MSIRFTALALLLASVFISNAAGVVHTMTLPNGDRLSGSVVEVLDGSWVFQSPYGTMTVPVSGAKVRDAKGIELKPEPFIKPKPVEQKQPKSVVEDEGVFDVARTLGLPESWTGQFDVGVTDIQGTSEKRTLAWNSKVVFPYLKNKFTWKTYYNYSESTGVADVDKYGTSLGTRHTLSERSFLRSLTAYSVDQIQGVDMQLDQTFGYGYKVVKTDSMAWEVVPGIGLQYIDQPLTEDGLSYIFNFYEEFNWQITEFLAFDHSWNISAPGDDTNDYSYVLDNSLSAKVSEHYFLKLGHEYDYKNNVARGKKKHTSTLKTSIGYKF